MYAAASTASDRRQETDRVFSRIRRFAYRRSFISHVALVIVNVAVVRALSLRFHRSLVDHTRVDGYEGASAKKAKERSELSSALPRSRATAAMSRYIAADGTFPFTTDASKRFH